MILEQNPVQFLYFKPKPVNMEAAREIQGNIESTATELYGLLDIKDRKYHLQTYKKVNKRENNSRGIVVNCS